MSGIIIEKRLMDLVKSEVKKASIGDLNYAANESFEGAYEFILCESMDCELIEVPEKLRERFIENDDLIFTDSDLIFADLTEAIELSLYKTVIYLVEELADNYSEDDSYDIEDNELYVELMDIYSASVTWCDFEFDRERDTLKITTYNFLDYKVSMELEISRMNQKEYILGLLIDKVKEALL